MIHQLFQDLPDDNFKIKLLNCYGIKDLNDKKEFTKNDLEDLEIIQKIEDLIPELVLYYLPCKYNMFLKNITVNKSITILRQILRL
jgi:ribonuclease HIII